MIKYCFSALNKLQQLELLLKDRRPQREFAKVKVEIQSSLPPVDQITKLLDLQRYQKITHRIEMNCDQQILTQLLKIISIDTHGNFVLRDNLIYNIIDHLKIIQVNQEQTQLLQLLTYKQSEPQQKIIEIIKSKISKPKDISEFNAERELSDYIRACTANNLDQIAVLEKSIFDNITTLNSKQLFLYWRAGQYRFPKKITQKIYELVQKGHMDLDPQSLINYIANQVKYTQDLTFVEKGLDIKLNQYTYGNWCHLISLLLSINKLDTKYIEKLKEHQVLADKLYKNEIFYFVEACLLASVEIDLESFVVKMVPFNQMRVLHILIQGRFEQYKQSRDYIIKILTDQDWIRSAQGYDDMGLLGFSLFDASMMEDTYFFELIIAKYAKQIDVINQAILSKESTGVKQFGGSMKEGINNQLILQVYQAFRHYELKTNKKLYSKNLEDQIDKLMSQHLANPSFMEDKVIHVLQQAGFQEQVNHTIEQEGKFYIREYRVRPYRLDIYIPSKKTSIDCVGLSHFYQGRLRQSDILKHEVLEYIIQILSHQGIKTILIQRGLDYDQLVNLLSSVM